MSEPSPELVEIAHACFDFARQGGTPSARATAQMFGREDLLRPGRS